MIKYFLTLTGCLLIVLPGWSQAVCRSFDYRQQQLRAHPELVSTVESVEQFTQRQVQPASISVTGEGAPQNVSPTVITVPVVVHVLYNTSQENISDDQILSQINVLNTDYQKLNGDTAKIPAYYRSLAANCGFRFILAGIDTSGYATTGIVRRHTNVSAFSMNDEMKSSATGGDEPWDRDKYLNIWVCNLELGTMGYSSVVGGPANLDGVVVLYTAFGTVGSAKSPYNLGRTCTHEVGHWLNLIHVWGDADCGDDKVADTPPQSQATYGNPSGIMISCGNTPYGNMYMDYMDFTDDIGMHMFTPGQRDRMRSLFVPGGFRNALLTSPAATAPAGIPAKAAIPGGGVSAPELYPNPTVSCVSVNLNNASEVGCLLEVYDQMGRLVLSSRATQMSFQLNVSGLAGGVYFVRLTNGSSQSTTRLVKL